MTVSSPPHLPEWPASSWRLPGTPLLITWTRGEGLLLWIQGRDPILSGSPGNRSKWESQARTRAGMGRGTPGWLSDHQEPEVTGPPNGERAPPE